MILNLLIQIFFIPYFWAKSVFGPNILKKCWPKIFMDPNTFKSLILWAKNVSGQMRIKFSMSNHNPQTKINLRMKFDSGVGPTCFLLASFKNINIPVIHNNHSSAKPLPPKIMIIKWIKPPHLYALIWLKDVLLTIIISTKLGQKTLLECVTCLEGNQLT